MIAARSRAGDMRLPRCASIPAMFFTWAARPLAFARAVGEFGSVVILSGNIPYRTEVASVHVFSLVENDDVGSAAAVSVVLLAISVLVLALLNVLQRRRTRHAE